LTNKLYEWPALYSILLTYLVSGSLIYLETSLGAKIAKLSIIQILLILLVICIVAKNILIPSRANRFLENAVPQNIEASRTPLLKKAKQTKEPSGKKLLKKTLPGKKEKEE
jgi:hypothetical protein